MSWTRTVSRDPIPVRERGNGVIAAIRDSKTAKHVKELGLPAVDVAYGDESQEERFCVITDDRRRAEMALEHFRNLGFQHFAYYGPSSLRYPARRGEAFFDVVVKAGFRCHLFPLSGANSSWHSVQDQTVDWLESLPRPLAVLAADPYPGVQLAKLCHTMRLRIPEEVAILAGDTDHLMCEVSNPPLSSIVLGCEQIGAESVRMLDLLLRGETPPEKSVLVSPLSIIPRESTDIVVADSCGFSSASHLCFAFKREMEQTPMEFRRANHLK
jgi:LacI family transcriptional regulator